MPTFERILADIGPSIVQVFGQDGRSLGFIFDSAGWVLTKQRIVKRNSRVSILFKDGHRESGVATGGDRINDLATIYFKPSQLVKALRLAGSDDMQLGRSVVSLKFSSRDGSKMVSAFRGKISELRRLLSPDLHLSEARLSAVRELYNPNIPLPIAADYVEIRSAPFSSQDTLGDLFISPQGRVVGLGRFSEFRSGFSFPPIWTSYNGVSADSLRSRLLHLQDFSLADYLEITVPAGERIELPVGIVSGDIELTYSMRVDPDLRFALLDPTGRPVVHHSEVSQVKYTVKPGKPGIYNWLLDNSYSLLNPKEVFLAYRTASPNPEIPTEEGLLELLEK